MAADWMEDFLKEAQIKSAAELGLRGDFYALHAMTPEDFCSDPIRVIVRILTVLDRQGQLQKALEAVEWVPAFTKGFSFTETCPACLRYKASGHAPGCKTAEALGRETNGVGPKTIGGDDGRSS
jgi:hypothetical protein